MKIKSQSVSVILSYTILILILFTTSPENMPLPVMLIPFLVIFICLYLTIDLMMRYLLKNLSIRSRMRTSIILAILPVLILILQSINQLTIRDVTITFVLFLLLIFYFKKADNIN